MAEGRVGAHFKIYYGMADSARGCEVLPEDSSLSIHTLRTITEDIVQLLMDSTGQTIGGDIAIFGMKKRPDPNAHLVGQLVKITRINQAGAAVS